MKAAVQTTIDIAPRLPVRKQKVVESADMMLQMVACGRGVAALPRWLVEEFSEKYPVRAV